MKTILVVDDEPDILELIAFNLEKEGYSPVPVTTGEDALREAGRIMPDLILLDRMLPGIDGIEVCRRLRQNPATRAIPVIMITARDEDTDVITGLEVGADDYVVKPFSPKILVARVRAALRRAELSEERPDDGLLREGGIEIDIPRHTVSAGGMPVELSATEFSILVLLLRDAGRVFSRAQIIDAVRGGNYPVTERSVDMQILGLRKNLGDYGDLIRTVRGFGYRLQAER